MSWPPINVQFFESTSARPRRTCQPSSAAAVKWSNTTGRGVVTVVVSVREAWSAALGNATAGHDAAAGADIHVLVCHEPLNESRMNPHSPHFRP